MELVAVDIGHNRKWRLHICTLAFKLIEKIWLDPISITIHEIF